MADIKWIKITTDMFDNRKIKHLRKLPEGNNIVLIWVMLLTMAGRCNAGGMIFLTENIPYTTKMLADELDFEENTVKLALQVLEQFEMIVTDGDYFAIAGWQEHQNVEGLEKVREQTRQRVAKHREKQKMLLGNVTGNATVTDGNATDKDIDKDKEIDKENIIKYGEFNNVILSSEEIEKLKAKFPNDWAERIETLSAYMKSKGKRYKSHYATILAWARKDTKEGNANAGNRGTDPEAPQRRMGTYI